MNEKNAINLRQNPPFASRLIRRSYKAGCRHVIESLAVAAQPLQR
jgi:hypothetical protein